MNNVLQKQVYNSDPIEWSEEKFTQFIVGEGEPLQNK